MSTCILLLRAATGQEYLLSCWLLWRSLTRQYVESYALADSLEEWFSLVLAIKQLQFFFSPVAPIQTICLCVSDRTYYDVSHCLPLSAIMILSQMLQNVRNWKYLVLLLYVILFNKLFINISIVIGRRQIIIGLLYLPCTRTSSTRQTAVTYKPYTP